MTVERSLRLVIVAIAALAVVELAMLSVTRLRQFTYDSMNYVTVARNASDGLGLVQSAAGFNEPIWNPDGPLRPPMTSQPPLFPLVIAGLHAWGFSFSTAALVAAVAGYASMLILLYAIARRLYDADVAAITLVLGLVSLPVRDLGVVAWSESIALSASLGAIWLLVAASQPIATSQFPGSKDPGLHPVIVAGAAGTLAGMAFATRYVFALTALMGLIFLIRTSQPRRRWIAASAFTSAFLAIAALVVARNYSLDGTFFGPARLASTSGWLENTRQVVEQAFGTWLGGPYVRLGWTALGSGAPDTLLQLAAFAVCAVVVLVFIVRRGPSDSNRSVAAVLFGDGRWLLPACSVSYLGYLIWQRSIVHFDVIDTRLVAPGLVFLLPAAAALLCRAFTDARSALVLALSLSVIVAVDQARLFAVRSPRSQIEGTRSERLQWIADHTSAADLIVGDDTVDIPFVHPDRVVVSFSRYPYSERLEFDRAAGWICARAANFRNVYVILRKNIVSEEAYGRFAGDVASGRVEAYRGLTSIATLEDAVVARLSCASR